MRIEKTGAQRINMKILKATKAQLTDHYEGVGKLRTRVGEEVFNETIDYMTSGMIVPIILEGEDVVRKIRKLCGPTRPWEAPAGTIRGDFGQKDPKLPIRNIIHESATPEEAK
jgi:nucleoside-diphosphate kinase